MSDLPLSLSLSRPSFGGLPPAPDFRQASFDDLGTPLRDVTFVVVDLETTGGSAHDCEITEIGAVKVRGGEVVGEFASLVRPQAQIPAFISVLTGITDTMLAGAPPLAGVLPAFLDFAAGSTLVAHNAPFDLGFLRVGCERLGLEWQPGRSVDTARLARRVLTRDEAPNCKLSTLAALVRADTQPCHRALADARATVDVLHALLARVGGCGVHTLEDLLAYSAQVPTAVRAKRRLAEGLPAAPGVYVFRDAAGRALYVGKSSNLRARVRTYFTAAEQRARMAEMVRIAEQVDHLRTATELEASVRELRLIASEQPHYNRRSRRQADRHLVKLTVERFPRLSVVRRVLDDGASYLGPFPHRRAAELAVAAVHDAVPLRQCSDRLGAATTRAACVLAELGRCGAPCEGRQSVAEYADLAEQVRTWIRADPRGLVDLARERAAHLAGAQRYEQAAVVRDRMTSFVSAAARSQAYGALSGIAELVAARPGAGRTWEVHLLRFGRLAGAAVAESAQAVRPLTAAVRATAEAVAGGPGPVPAATAEEMALVCRWLDAPGVRLVDASAGWALPVRGAGGIRLPTGAARHGGGNVMPDAREPRYAASSELGSQAC